MVTQADANPAPKKPDGPIGYVLKMYPRFSETFVVSEILAREAAGEELVIFSLRPPTDPRFHPELARVQAPVIQVDRTSSPRRWWESWRQLTDHPDLAAGAAAALPDLLAVDHDDAVQAVALARLAREHGVTHLHAHFASVATTVARLAGRIATLPYSFTAHAKDIFHSDVDPADLARKLTEAHHAVTISRYNLDHLRKRFGPRVTASLHLVRNGLELERFPFRPGVATGMASPGRSAAAPETESLGARLLAVGRLVEKKGFAHAVDAVARLRTSGVDCTLDIVGDGPVRDDLQARIDAHGLGGAVRLLGPRTQAEVQRLMLDHDLFVAPFVIAEDGNADGLPTVLLEAMACGIACVAADVTAVGEVIMDGDTGWLVPSGDLDALVTAVRAAIASPEERLRRITAARHWVVDRYDSARQAEALRHLVTADESTEATDSSEAVPVASSAEPRPARVIVGAA